MDPENREACYDQLKHFFEPTPHSSEIQVLKQILEHQFNKSQPFTNRGDMADVINQVVLLKVNTVKEGLLYFTMCYKGKHFVPAMKEFQRLSEYKGQRLKNVHLLTKFLDQNSYTPIGNPITDLKENAVRMFDRKDMLNNSVFQFFSMQDAKKFFFHLISTPSASRQVTNSFHHLNVVYINKSKEGLIPKTHKIASKNLQVNQQQRHCYVYFCEKGSHPQLKNNWIMAVQSLQPSIQNRKKTLISFEREDYVLDPGQIQEQSQIIRFSDINSQTCQSQRVVDMILQQSQENDQKKSNDSNLEQQLLQQMNQSRQIQAQIHGSTVYKGEKKVNQLVPKIQIRHKKSLIFISTLIVILILATVFVLTQKSQIDIHTPIKKPGKKNEKVKNSKKTTKYESI